MRARVSAQETGTNLGHKKSVGINKKPSRHIREGRELVWRNLCGAHDIAGLKTFRAFEQIELDGLAFIQRAVAVLLDGREMHEYILAGGALDKSVSLRPVEPLHSTLLSHKETPFASSLRIILAARVFALLRSPDLLALARQADAEERCSTPPQCDVKNVIALPRDGRNRANGNGSLCISSSGWARRNT